MQTLYVVPEAVMRSKSKPAPNPNNLLEQLNYRKEKPEALEVLALDNLTAEILNDPKLSEWEKANRLSNNLQRFMTLKMQAFAEIPTAPPPAQDVRPPPPPPPPLPAVAHGENFPALLPPVPSPMLEPMDGVQARGGLKRQVISSSASTTPASIEAALAKTPKLSKARKKRRGANVTPLEDVESSFYKDSRRRTRARAKNSSSDDSENQKSRNKYRAKHIARILEQSRITEQDADNDSDELTDQRPSTSRKAFQSQSGSGHLAMRRWLVI